MPHTRDPDPISPAPQGAVPPCFACGKQMRLIRCIPSVRYVNLDDCTFKCECGEEAEFILMRQE